MLRPFGYVINEKKRTLWFFKQIIRMSVLKKNNAPQNADIPECHMSKPVFLAPGEKKRV